MPGPELLRNNNLRCRSVAWMEALARLIYPPRCLLCRALLPAEGAPDPLCERCGPFFSPAGLLCPHCEQFYPRQTGCKCSPSTGPLKGLFALSWYEGEWRLMLHRLKFEGRRQLARPLGSWLGKLLLQQAEWNLELVVPLPLHRQRQRQRGYNQSYLIARHAARSLQLPLASLLVKTRATPSQMGLSRQERRVNVAGAFSPARLLPRAGAVLLVDDIYSTGASLKEAASVLSLQGYLVYGAVAAYNPGFF